MPLKYINYNNFFYSEYTAIFIFACISVIIVFILLFISWVINPKSIDIEKSSAYECGFEPFDSSRKSFDVQYYIVGVLFLIFDLEIAFIFPWACSLSNLGLFGFWTMIFFFFILVVGFVYEWQRGALDWSFSKL